MDMHTNQMQASSTFNVHAHTLTHTYIVQMHAQTLPCNEYWHEPPAQRMHKGTAGMAPAPHALAATEAQRAGATHASSMHAQPRQAPSLDNMMPWAA